MTKFTIRGMTCGHCEAAVRRAVQSVDPAAAITIDRPTGAVAVDSRADPGALAAAIRAEGYEAELR